MVQGVLTVVAEVSPAHLPALVSLLAELDAALDGQGGPPVVDFRALETVHFARFVVLPPNAAGKTHLAFSVAYDGPLNVHIDELVVRAGDGLCTVFAHCTGFPESASAANDLRAYLTARAIPYGAMHVGYVGRTMSDVRREEALRRFIGQTLDAAKISTLPTPERPARVIRKEVIDLVAKSEFRWALEPRAAKIAPSGVEGWWKGTAAVLVGVAALAVAIAAAFAVGHGGCARTRTLVLARRLVASGQSDRRDGTRSRCTTRTLCVQRRARRSRASSARYTHVLRGNARAIFPTSQVATSHSEGQ